MPTTQTLLLLVASLSCNASPLLRRCPYPDVPPNHWALEAINRGIDEGLMVDPRGFRGEEPITRYQVAVIAAKLIDGINHPVALPASAQAIARANIHTQSLRAQLEGITPRVEQLEATVRELRLEAALLRSRRGIPCRRTQGGMR